MGRALRVPPMGMSITMYSGEGRWDASHGERVPPTGTRKSALRRWRGADIFLMPALVRARRRVWGSGGTRGARSPYGYEHNDMLEREG